ncbi:MAG: hypothetical protein HYX66_08575 [Ignavibacteria bacterium]|nr:hypothetical protein [Ignavibacteria bacterium]
MKKTFMFMAILPVLACSGWAREIAPADQILDSLLVDVCAEIANQIPPIDTLHIDVSIHPDAEFVESVLLESLSKRTTVFSRTNGNNILKIIINDMSTRYRLVDDDSVQRVITVTLRASLELNGVVKPLNITDRSRIDVGSRREAEQADSEQHAASHGHVPDAERTFWDDILEPAIFVAVAATTVILLFTVRSK